MAAGSVLAGARPLVVARAYSAAATFFIPVVLARLLAIEEYGTFKQFFLVATTLYLALSLGMPQSLYYFLPRHEGAQRRTFLAQTLIWLLLAGAAAGIFLAHATPLITWVGGEALAELRVPMAIYCGCLLAAGSLEAGLTAQGRIRHAAISFAVSDTARTAAFVVPALLGLGLRGVVSGAAIFTVLRLGAAWLVHGRSGGAPMVERTFLRAQVQYALPFGMAMLVAIPQQQFHQYVVAVATAPAAFAIYAVGCFNLPVVDLLYSPTSELLMYRLGRQEREGRPAEEGAAAFREAAGQLAYAFLPIAAGLFAIAPSFLSLIYGARFVESAPIFRISLVVVVLACFPVDGVLRARARTRALFLSYLAKAIASVPAVLLLFRELGPIGAMVGFAVVEVAHKALLVFLAARALLPQVAERSPLAALHRILPAGQLLRAGLAAGGSATVALLIGGAFPTEPLFAVLIEGGGFWLVYFGALVAAGMRPAAVLRSLRP